MNHITNDRSPEIIVGVLTINDKKITYGLDYKIHDASIDELTDQEIKDVENWLEANKR